MLTQETSLLIMKCCHAFGKNMVSIAVDNYEEIISDKQAVEMYTVEITKMANLIEDLMIEATKVGMEEKARKVVEPIYN